MNVRTSCLYSTQVMAILLFPLQQGNASVFPHQKGEDGYPNIPREA